MSKLPEYLLKGKPRLVRRGDSDMNIAYRPLLFSEYHGPTRKAAASFYKQLVASRRVGKPRLEKQSYLITGASGTGKTTLALTVGLALNCTDPQPSKKSGEIVEPCLKCPACKSILKGAMIGREESPVRVINSAVMDKAAYKEILVNDLLAPIGLLPGKNRVVIFDEVHEMLNKQLQVFLNPLESLPPHAYVFYATSHPRKFKEEALKSRISKVALPPWTTQDIVFMLMDIMINEHNRTDVNRAILEEEALFYIAQQASGNPRDAITTLQYVLTNASGTKGDTVIIGVKGVQKIAPNAEDTAMADDKFIDLKDIFQAFYSNDISRALKRVEELEKTRINGVDIIYPINKFLKNRVYSYAHEGNEKGMVNFAQKLEAFTSTALQNGDGGEIYANLISGLVRALCPAQNV